MSASEGHTERAYPYWPGWHMVGCSVLFFGLIGAGGVSLFPAGYDRLRSGDLPTGVAMMVLGVFGVPTLAMSVLSLAAGVRDALRPPLLELTATALVLPAEARGEPPQDEYGEPTSAEPPHPQTVPLAAVRAITTGGPGAQRVLELVHDLSREPLRIHRRMMRAADFSDLEARLRAALPAAFASAPATAQNH